MNEVTEETRDRVKRVAIEMAREAGGLIHLTCRDLCDRAGVSDGSFSHIMGQSFAAFVGDLRLHGGVPLCTQSTTRKGRAAHPLVRQDQILAVALEMAKEGHYLRVTRDRIAERAGVAAGSVTRYFGTMKQLQRALMRAAVTHGVVEVVAQGIIERDPQALKAPESLLSQARDHVMRICQEGA